jgi:hypothetical protein
MKKVRPHPQQFMSDPYPTEGYQPEQVDSYPTEGYQVDQLDPYPTEGYAVPTIDAYPTEGYQQPDSSNAYQIPENYPNSPSPRSPEIVSYIAVSGADQRKIASANLSEKLVSDDPSLKLMQGQYLQERQAELEESAERIEAKRSIQEKLEANRQQHGRTEPTQNQDKGIER